MSVFQVPNFIFQGFELLFDFILLFFILPLLSEAVLLVLNILKNFLDLFLDVILVPVERYLLHLNLVMIKELGVEPADLINLLILDLLTQQQQGEELEAWLLSDREIVASHYHISVESHLLVGHETERIVLVFCDLVLLLVI